MTEETRQVYEFDEFRIDPAKRQLLREGEVVPLYSKAFDLLLLLVESNGRDLSKDEILESIWPGQILEESNLTVNISAVRRALGEKAAQPRFLVTIPGRGYRFVGRVRKADEFLIETETISQIIVEEGIVEGDDSITASPQPTSLASEQSAFGQARASFAAQPQPKQLVAGPTRSLFKRPAVLAVTALCALVAILASAYALRAIRSARSTANRFQQIKLRQLTNDGGVSNAAISPDGKLFAFAHNEKDKKSLRLGQMNGEAPIELLPPANVTYWHITFSADGRSIYYTAAENGPNRVGLFKLPLLGGVPVKLRDDFPAYFTLSPDDKLVGIVLWDAASRTNRLVVSNLDGTNERVLSRLPPGRGLYGPNISWSPDGSLLAMGLSMDESGGQGAIYIMPSNGGEPKALTKPMWRAIERTAWLKDNAGILLIGASQDREENRQLWSVDYPTGETRRLTSDLNNYSMGLSVTSDADSVLLVQHQQINNVWVAPVGDFSRAKQITFGAFNRNDGLLGVDWAPNGKIIYTAMVANSSTIWSMDADGSNAKELTPPGASDSVPSVAIDGHFIVFESHRGGTTQIWRMNVDGTSPTQLTNCGINSQPDVSPDGKWVVYVSTCGSDGGLWRISIDGGEPKRLADKPGFWPWVSPDSKWVACEYWVSGEKSQLAIVSIEGGPPTKLFDLPPLANFRYGIRWTPDGRAVTYRDWGKGLWRQPIDGGPLQQIPGLPDEKIFSYGWSRDAKLFAFTRGVELRDALLISSN